MFRVFVSFAVLTIAGDRSPMQTDQRLFSEGLLAKYDGSDPEQPIYIAVGNFLVTMCRTRRVHPRSSP